MFSKRYFGGYNSIGLSVESMSTPHYGYVVVNINHPCIPCFIVYQSVGSMALLLNSCLLLYFLKRMLWRCLEAIILSMESPIKSLFAPHYDHVVVNKSFLYFRPNYTVQRGYHCNVYLDNSFYHVFPNWLLRGLLSNPTSTIEFWGFHLVRRPRFETHDSQEGTPKKI